MRRVGNDPHQPGRIEQPFLQVEIPGPGLLRQQATLQPVGQAPDQPLQLRQLLVEELAQA